MSLLLPSFVINYIPKLRENRGMNSEISTFGHALSAIDTLSAIFGLSPLLKATHCALLVGFLFIYFIFCLLFLLF